MAVTAGARMAHALLARLEREGKLDEALRYEILGGELVIRGVPQMPHEDAVGALFRCFANWAHRHGGKASTSAGVEIGEHQLVPDVAFIGPDRVAELDLDGFHVPPDLVGEVTSPKGRGRDLVDKREIYAEIGVPEYWVVDLSEPRVVAHRLAADGGYEAAEHTGGTLTTPRAPGLEVPVVELFPDR